MRAAAASAIIAALCLAPAVARPAEQDPAPKIDALFASFTHTTPGCAVGVAKNGSPVFAKGYGMADLDHGIPITAKTMFNLGSVSKQFTAMTVLSLAKDGKLALTDSVRKYLPELPPYADKITLQQLLNHTSGLRDYMALGGLAGLPDDAAYTDDVALRMVARQQALNFEPGTRFLYSNSGYVLLSIIVARVTGKPFSEVAHDAIFTPLGMASTAFHGDHSALIENRAVGYDLDKTVWRQAKLMVETDGDGALYSSLDDMFRWMANFDAPKVGADALSQMETSGRLNNGQETGYGLGLESLDYHGHSVIEHNGAIDGYLAVDMWYPAQRLAVVVLCNNDDANPTALAQKVSDLYLTAVPRLPGQPLPSPSAPLANSPEVAVDAKLLDRYVGDYQVQPGMIITLTRDKDHLIAVSTGQPAVATYAVSNSTFRLKGIPAEIELDRPAGDGKAQSGVIRTDEAAMKIKRVTVVQPTGQQLKAYEGKFYSPELDVTYEVASHDGALAIRYPGGVMALGNQMVNGAFTTPGGRSVRFECPSRGPCTGLSIDAGRALNLKFKRVASTAAAAARP